MTHFLVCKGNEKNLQNAIGRGEKSVKKSPSWVKSQKMRLEWFVSGVAVTTARRKRSTNEGVRKVTKCARCLHVNDSFAIFAVEKH